MILRDYQLHAVNEMERLMLAGNRPVGQAPTGSGKGAILAELARRMSAKGRVMILVDTVKLVKQLAAEIEEMCAFPPGIEMGESRATDNDQIIVSTYQSQYSGPSGFERYRRFVPSEFAAVLIDETESAFPDNSYRAVVDYYLSNPNCRVAGVTATAFRSDGIGAARLFDCVAFEYTAKWGIDQGWLVQGMQRFVRLSLDFSTLKIKENEDGEKDYSPEDIASLLKNERTLIEISRGIVQVVEDRKSIVICPTVAFATALADHLDSVRPGCAKAIHGDQDEVKKEDLFTGHQRGDFQFLVSVNMLVKGYNDCSIEAVVLCRKTRSRRLYTQIIGRGLRPSASIASELGNLPAAEDRQTLIAASEKPSVMIVDLVGIDANVKDMTLVDIMGDDDPGVNEAAKRLQMEGMDIEAAMQRAQEQVAVSRGEAMEAAQDAAEALEDDETMVAIRRAFDVEVTAVVEDVGGISTGSAPAPLKLYSIDPKHLNILRKAKVPEADITRMTHEGARKLSSQIVVRWKKNLCSYRQGLVLRELGYSKEAVHDMPYDEASRIIGDLQRQRA